MKRSLKKSLIFWGGYRRISLMKPVVTGQAPGTLGWKKYPRANTKCTKSGTRLRVLHHSSSPTYTVARRALRSEALLAPSFFVFCSRYDGPPLPQDDGNTSTSGTLVFFFAVSYGFS